MKVTKRQDDSSLMQLKEEYCKYESLRHEHDKQIVQIAHEAGLRIAPDQWSSLLYGDTLPVSVHAPVCCALFIFITKYFKFSDFIATFFRLLSHLFCCGNTSAPCLV